MSIKIESEEARYKDTYLLLTSLNLCREIGVNDRQGHSAELGTHDPDLEPVLIALREYAKKKMEQRKAKDREDKMDFVKGVLAEYPNCIGFNAGVEV